jgi:hypothetical protein
MPASPRNAPLPLANAALKKRPTTTRVIAAASLVTASPSPSLNLKRGETFFWDFLPPLPLGPFF